MSIGVENLETRLPVTPLRIRYVEVEKRTPYLDGQHLEEHGIEHVVFDNRDNHPAAKAAHESLQFSAELL